MIEKFIVVKIQVNKIIRKRELNICIYSRRKSTENVKIKSTAIKRYVVFGEARTLSYNHALSFIF